MDWREHCAAVIPCLNEAKGIGVLVRQVREHLPGVFVVDDGSDDGTGAQAADAGAIVVSHTNPQGKGRALKAGWRAALHAGYTWALNMDGDGQHAPGDIPGFLAAAAETDAPLIIGNRMMSPKGMPAVRRVVNWWMSARLSKRAGQLLPDTQCGYRMLHLPTAKNLRLKTDNFEIESEIVLAFARAGLSIGFVPIQVIYGGQTSKIRPWRDTMRWLRWWMTA